MTKDDIQIIVEDQIDGIWIYGQLDCIPIIQSSKLHVSRRDLMTNSIKSQETANRIKDEIWKLYLEKHGEDVDLNEKLVNVDNGRFKDLLKYFNVTKECWDCLYFNTRTGNDHYRCHSPGSCIGGTLSENFKSYLIKKVLDKEKE